MTREILWNIPQWIVTASYILFGAICIGIGLWIQKRRTLWKQGSMDATTRSLAPLFEFLWTHKALKKDPYARTMHRLLLWGFVILLIATTLVAIEHHLHTKFLQGTFYLWFSFVSDLGGVAFLIGLSMALWRRRDNQKARLRNDWTISFTLWVLVAVTVSGFLLEGARIANNPVDYEIWSPVGFAIAKILSLFSFQSISLPSFHLLLWIGHAIVVAVFFLLIPLTMFRHILLAPFSLAGTKQELGTLLPSPSPALSATSLPDFRRKDFLHADTCLTCGLCTEVCPAQAAEKPLSPRSIVLGVRESMQNASSPVSRFIASDAVWSCTSCHACDQACPVGIRILDKIVTTRRGLVAEGDLPQTAVAALEETAQRYNPFGRPNSDRMDWALGLQAPVAKPKEKIDLLFWVGCAGSFDPSGKEVSRAMLKLLNHTKTSYRVLGCQERCTGDPARRLGEEGLWQRLSQQNQKLFAEHEVDTIVTSCPHCLHSLKNEYPKSERSPKVIHHTEWIAQNVADKKIQVSANEEKITYHDPCYLARANNQTEKPREILGQTTSDFVELEEHGKQTLCCGGGGGQLWLDVRGKERLENRRAQQISQSQCETVATGCPFCKGMIEAGRDSLPEANFKVKDIAELTAQGAGL